MRVTTNMLVSQVLSDLREADARRLRVHEQLSSGRRIERPSDDPADVVTALRYRSSLTETGQYIENVGSARDWLDVTESVLRNATNVVQRARELAVTAANSHLAQGSLNAVAEEVSGLRDELIQLGNTSHGERYIFGGYQTTAPPFDPAGSYSGDAATISREIGPGVFMGVNLPGNAVFSNALTALGQLVNDLQAGDINAVGGADLADLDAVLDDMMAFRARVGAKVNHLNLAEYRLQETDASLKRLQSDIEEVDIAETAVNLSVQENAYRVALAAAGRLIQPTLLDFLR